MNRSRKKSGDSRNRIWRDLYRRPAVGILVHWVFQGVLNMDRTERLFKIVLDLAATAGLAILLSTRLSLLPAVGAGFLTAHTLNFLFNGQLWDVLKASRAARHSRAQFVAYVESLAARMRREPAITAAIVCGSVVRGEWHEAADLDLRLLRAPGSLNGLRSCWFLLAERTRALFARFPLDAYVLDNEASLSKLRGDEVKYDLLKPAELGQLVEMDIGSEHDPGR
jgi:predicted nucleotidyltransferase